jgi:branched-chain amino acid transport system substrate-binding protein
VKQVRLLSLVALFFLITGFQGVHAETGVTDTEIVLGVHSEQTGPRSLFGVIQRVMKAYFDMINEQGGVNGRKIKFLIEDAAGNAQQTVQVTKKLVEKDNIFAMVTGQGPNHIAVYKYLRDKKVPDVLFLDSNTAYTNPPVTGTYSWTPTFKREAEYFGEYAAKKWPGKKLGILVPETEEGKEAATALEDKVKGKMTVAAKEEVKWAAPNSNAQILNLKKAGVDVVYMLGTPPVIAAAMKFAKEQGLKAQWIVGHWGCSKFLIDLAGKDATEGTISHYYTFFETDTELPQVQKFLDFAKKHAPNEKIASITLGGYAIAEVTVEALKRAGKNLTREGFNKAFEGMTGYKCSVCRTPTTISKGQHVYQNVVSALTVKDGKWVPLQDPLLPPKEK